MTRLGVAVAVWALFVFIAWNVTFDRYVVASSLEFTREQVTRHQRGESLTSIHEGFSPRVREAALQASLRVSPLVVIGAGAIVFGFRRER